MIGKTSQQRVNAIHNSRNTKRQTPKTLADGIDWDICIANLKAMLEHLDRRKDRQ